MNIYRESIIINEKKLKKEKRWRMLNFIVKTNLAIFIMKRVPELILCKRESLLFSFIHISI